MLRTDFVPGSATILRVNGAARVSADPALCESFAVDGKAPRTVVVIETRAVKAAFGNHAATLAVSSTKSMIGHLLGAAGGVEAVFSVLSLRDQVAPPTINLEEPDDECDLDYVANEARKMSIDVALSNSFGFGGTNGTVIFKRLA